MENIIEPSYMGIVKLVSVLLILGLGILFGVLPYKWRKIQQSLVFLSYANVFSGGLFISMGLIHLLPEATLVFNTFQLSEKGLWLINYKENENTMLNKVNINGTVYKIEEKYCQNEAFFPFPWAFMIVIFTIAFCLFIEKIAFVGNTHSHSMIIKSPIQKNSRSLECDGFELEEKNNFHKDKEENLIENLVSHQDESSKKMSPYLILIALSIHSVFEALALGIITNFTFYMNLFLAIMLHKWAESLSLSITFINAGYEFKEVKTYIIFFAFTAPSGLIVGWVLSYLSRIISAIFFSISAGTFVYITLIEILADEFDIIEEKKQKIFKFILFLIGNAIITGIWFMEE